MFERLFTLYKSERLTLTQVRTAVNRGWINAEQYFLITDELFPTD